MINRPRIGRAIDTRDSDVRDYRIKRRGFNVKRAPWNEAYVSLPGGARKRQIPASQ